LYLWHNSLNDNRFNELNKALELCTKDSIRLTQSFLTINVIIVYSNIILEVVRITFLKW